MRKIVRSLLGILFGCAAIGVASFGSSADVVILESGQVMTGEILQHDQSGVLFKMDYGTFTYPNWQIKDARRDTNSATATQVSVPDTNRIPNWGRIISLFAKADWAHDLKQIPATVIDTGVLKNVPYISFRCASGGYELNIYGNLDHPAGVEIGVLTFLIKNQQAKSNCVELLHAVLSREDDKAVVRQLKWDKQVVVKDGLTFETTLPTEPDAYGGWWISVYDESALEKVRASGQELLAITQPRVPQAAPPAPAFPAATQVAATSENSGSIWSPDDLIASRSPRYSSGGGSTGGGSVYVRGYTRSNGTYVHSYTRSAPGRR